MTRKYFTAAALLAGLMLLSSAAIAEDASKSDAAKTPAPRLSAHSTTDRELESGGRRIAYQASAGTIIVGATSEQDSALGPDGHPWMFYVAYIKKDEKPENRPIS